MTLPKKQLETLVAELESLQEAASALAAHYSSKVRQVHPAYRQSAKNLLHYLALRQHDNSEMQQQLAELGLSSLGRTESHVLASLQAVTRQLCFLLKCKPEKTGRSLSFTASKQLLKTN